MRDEKCAMVIDLKGEGFTSVGSRFRGLNVMLQKGDGWNYVLFVNGTYRVEYSDPELLAKWFAKISEVFRSMEEDVEKSIRGDA